MKPFWQITEPSKIFDQLKEFDFILVVGPQRAGTTITGVMIANDLHYAYLEESEIWDRLDLQPPEPPASRNFIEFFKPSNNGCVIHCPEHTAYCHLYAGLKNVAVVMVKRKVSDIIASQKRVGWGFEDHELLHYPGEVAPIAEVKYKRWKQQKEILGRQAFEVKYNNLSKHPLWVPKNKRAEFAIAQVEVGNPRGQFVQNKELVR